MSHKRVYIHVNGILTVPGDSRNWTGRAVTWTHIKTEHWAEKVEYFSGPLLGRLVGHMARVNKLIATMGYYAAADFQIVLVAHSNGSNVVIDALKAVPGEVRRAVSQIHLFSPACEADFEKNGLNRYGIPVAVYVAGKDSALRLANNFFAHLLGYGVLGLHGPQNVALGVAVNFFEAPAYGHGDWFADDVFDRTMKRLMNTPIDSRHQFVA